MGRCRLRGDSPPVRFRLQGRPLTKSVLGFYTLGSSCQRFAPKAKPQQALKTTAPPGIRTRQPDHLGRAYLMICSFPIPLTSLFVSEIL